MRVLIIGAGTGGLCLAHRLRQAGIDVAVYERDRTRGGGLQGYRVGIDPDGSHALYASLPRELYDTFVATCARTPDRFNMFTENLKEVLSLEGFAAEGEEGRGERSVSRMTLRQVLLTGLEDIVHFDKVFSRYEQHPDGAVTAYFEDGSSATGDVLVGADGTNSRVRRQYLPHAELRDSGVVGLAGKAPLTDETRALLTPQIMDGVNIIQAPKGVTCIIHVMQFPWDADGAPKGGIGATDTALIKAWPGLQFDNTRDYIIAGMNVAASYLPGGVLDMSGAQVHDLMGTLTKDWHPRLRRLFALTDPSTCFTINIRTSVPIPQWPTTTITMIGDAIHTMTPGRGVGANTALRDATLLGRNLTAHANGTMSLHDAIRDYETQMIDYGFAAVKKSLAEMDGDAALNKPVIGRALLAGMRTGMRAVNHLPPLKRKFAAGMRAERGHDRDS